MLMNNPSVELPLFFSVLTNPSTQGPRLRRGRAGIACSLQKWSSTGASPLNEQTGQALVKQLVSGSPDVRVRTIDLLGTFIRMMRKGNDDKTKNRAAEWAEMIHKSTGDSLSPVRAEATFMTAILAEPNASEAMIGQMTNDASFAANLCVRAMQVTMDPSKQKELAQQVAKNDADPIVKMLAKSVVEVADIAPASQPTTQAAGDVDSK